MNQLKDLEMLLMQHRELFVRRAAALTKYRHAQGLLSPILLDSARKELKDLDRKIKPLNARLKEIFVLGLKDRTFFQVH